MSAQPILVFGDGAQTRNVLYVGDAVEALWNAAHDPRLFGGTFFVAHDDHISVRQIAETIVRVFERGSVASVAWPDRRRRIEVDSVRISSKRFRAITGWRSRYSFEEGLRKTRMEWEAGLGAHPLPQAREGAPIVEP
jgi:UDP-glucose 4-epimerase